MKNTIFFILPILIFSFCKNENNSPQEVELKVIPLNTIEENKINSEQNKNGKTIAERINPNKGYQRIKVDKNSFAHYLRHFPLKPHGSKVFYFNGKEKYRQDVHAAVIDLDVGKRDLQQCADAIMRLRSEYLFAQKKYENIHFNFVNGFNAEYQKWRNGNRIKVNGNKVKWVATQSESDSYESFRKYLDMVFSYAGTLSLAKEMKSIPIEEMKIGDVFIQGGSPGHAVIVVDISENKTTGKKQYLLAQSYMPAQDIHVLKNPNGGVWYDLDFKGELETPEWIFGKGDLKRF